MRFKTATLFLIIPLVVLLAYLLMGPVRKYILSPILYALRIGSIIYEALPQSVWWGIFLFILAIISYRSLTRSRNPVSEDIRFAEEERLSSAKAWSRWIWMSRRGNYSKWLLARHSAELVLNIQAYQERQPLEQIRAQILNGKFDAPPEILDYLQVGLGVPSFRHYSELLSRFQSTQRASPLNLDPEVIIQFLETRIYTGGSV